MELGKKRSQCSVALEPRFLFPSLGYRCPIISQSCLRSVCSMTCRLALKKRYRRSDVNTNFQNYFCLICFSVSNQIFWGHPSIEIFSRFRFDGVLMRKASRYNGVYIVLPGTRVSISLVQVSRFLSVSVKVKPDPPSSTNRSEQELEHEYL